MSETTIRGSTYRLEIEREQIPITMGWTYTADPHWTHTDRQGHEHRYDGGYPTLEHIIDAQHWCDGAEGFGAHDPHMAIDESHWECRQCREVIEPGLIPPGMTTYLPGAMTAMLSGPASSGVLVTMLLTDAQVTRLANAGDTFDAEALAMIDTADEGWIVKRERPT